MTLANIYFWQQSIIRVKLFLWTIAKLKEWIPIETIDLHGLTLDQARDRLQNGLEDAFQYNVGVVRIIHGRGKHSEVFPVIKSYVRHWLKQSIFARERIASVFYGEDGSPYTSPNPGETIVLFKGANQYPEDTDGAWEEEEFEARKNAKSIRADRLRTLRRRPPRR